MICTATGAESIISTLLSLTAPIQGLRSGDQAVARGTYAATVTPKDGSEEIFIDGKYMTLLKRQPDGSWKIFRDIYNSNMPPN